MASKELFTAILVLLITLSLRSNNNNGVKAQLNAIFYSNSCKNVHSIGCDASILLKDTTTFTGDQNAVPIRNSLGGLDAIDEIKLAVEKACPEVMSCADILAISGRPEDKCNSIPMKLGRRDATTASQAAVECSIPSRNSSLDELISSFLANGLTQKEMVALSGVHTIWQASCINFRTRIYNETNINSDFATMRQGTCPSTSGSGDGNLAPLSVNFARVFDNNCFKNLLAKRGLLHFDQQLYNRGSTDNIVESYSLNSNRFRINFKKVRIKMAEISANPQKALIKVLIKALIKALINALIKKALLSLSFVGRPQLISSVISGTINLLLVISWLY